MRVLSTRPTNSSPAAHSATSLTSRLSLALVRKYRAHKTATALSSLSDDELEDIGLVRAEILTIAERAAL